MAKRWYVVHVYSGFEKKIAQQIKEQGIHVSEEAVRRTATSFGVTDLDAFMKVGKSFGVI